MEEGDDWATLFFSGQPPDFVKLLSNNPDFRAFFAGTDGWQLGERVDKFREACGMRIQVFWLRIKGHRKYMARVVSVIYQRSPDPTLILFEFLDYTPAQAAAQLRRFYVPESRIRSPESSLR
jgi:hypothetical protein